MHSTNKGSPATVIPLERAGRKIGDDKGSVTTLVGETVDRGIGLIVVGFSIMSGASRDVTVLVSCCLLPS